ncbi:tetratricopeptide repeat protein [Gracilimonas mengyeensis]|uniref:Regulator of microtubule dynamics protein 1 n=1 Tax=Gracilimonas mengyeensis TaxID=1302730 RepID=A0A521DGU1_9BACT|nr:tetratricopeptide repeat protein [Gracilimonas mengyeensis]SMO70848.1 Tetratricopeptide repeat-containing protein [Gracilimonas mengyeensis]
MKPFYSVVKACTLFLFGVMMISKGVLAQAPANKSIETQITKADSLFNEAEEEEALEIYKAVLKRDSTHYKALWRTALLFAREGYRQPNKKAMEPYYREAMNYAERVLEHHPEKGYTHFVYAVASGRISDISGNEKRIELSHVVKEHAEKAVELLPEYAPAWHLLGLWHSKVANTGGGKKLVAGLFSKGLPEGASNQKAEEYILKAIKLDPEQSIRYQLDLGRHYQRAGETEKARQALQKVLDEEAKTKFDRENQQQARQILDDLG